MKKILLSTLTALLLTSMAMAQSKDGSKHFSPRHFHQHHRMDLSKTLNFSDEQKQQWKTISQDYRQKMSDLNKQEDITVGQMRDKKAALIKDQRNAFQNLLTTDQKNKLADMKRKGEQRRNEMAAQRLEKMKTKLNLSDDQTAKIKTLDDQFRESIKKYRDDQGQNRTENKTALMSMFKQHKDDVMNVLSPDQQTKLNDWKKEKTGRF